jgi:hypothetical protein
MRQRKKKNDEHEIDIVEIGDVCLDVYKFVSFTTNLAVIITARNVLLSSDI